MLAQHKAFIPAKEIFLGGVMMWQGRTWGTWKVGTKNQSSKMPTHGHGSFCRKSQSMLKWNRKQESFTLPDVAPVDSIFLSSTQKPRKSIFSGRYNWLWKTLFPSDILNHCSLPTCFETIKIILNRKDFNYSKSTTWDHSSQLASIYSN